MRQFIYFFMSFLSHLFEWSFSSYFFCWCSIFELNGALLFFLMMPVAVVVVVLSPLLLLLLFQVLLGHELHRLSTVSVRIAFVVDT